jgi:heat shock protein HtpX
MTASPAQSVLVYDRIFQNRVKTGILLLIAVLSILPFVAAISYGGSAFITSYFGPRRPVGIDPALLRELTIHRRGALATDQDRSMELEVLNQLETINRRSQKDRGDYWKFRLRAMALVAAGLTAILGLLFWGLVASPTSQMLSMCDARPAGPSETEARRILDNISIAAGLPPPRLCVIDTPTPNAFAAGMRPEHSVIVVTSGLLALMDHRELEGVLAHELSHIGNRDTRLNTVVAAITLFLRLPYLMKQKKKRAQRAGYHWSRQNRNYRLKFEIALIPLYIYVFFIAPFLAALIRAAISRSREFLADADAALITRYPEGLLRALAKIGGAGSSIASSNPVISHLYFANPAPAANKSFFSGSLLATHPSIEKRIYRLMEFSGGVVPETVIKQAILDGTQFGKDHPPVVSTGLTETVTSDELSVLTMGNPLGRACRALQATRLYDQPKLDSSVLARIPAGALLVVFDDPGKFRQVLTHDQEFGYIPASVKLKKLDIMPAEVFDPAARARLEDVQPAAPDVAGTAYPAAAAYAAAPKSGLSATQIMFAAGFFVVVFAGIFLVLLSLNK